jgi:acetyl-CoA carboxylase biotin carboxyl carrier protein
MSGDALTPDHGSGLDGSLGEVEIIVHEDGLASPGSLAADETALAEPPRDRGDQSLLALIDRLATMLERSGLSELEVGSGGTDVILRKPSAIAAPIVVGAGSPAAGATGGPGSAPGPAESPGVGREAASPDRPSIKAPLTGIFYASPAPGSAPYVKVGGEVAVGQVIGLIEAMKLFNEIKSDLAGRVVRVIPESGTLVKAKQPLLEVDPL